jgi:hypothetical protein
VGFDSSGSKNPGIAYINSKTRKIEKLIYSNERGRYLSHFQTSQTKDSLFFLQNGVFMVRENSSEFPTQNFAKNLSGNWYGMGFDPKRREIFIRFIALHSRLPTCSFRRGSFGYQSKKQ